jgi:hypothetical protein
LRSSGCNKGGTNGLEDEKMVKKEKPETLIQLLALYRHAEFPSHQARARDLAGVARTIQSNCAVTIHFAESKLRNLEEEGEEVFTLCELKDQARILKKRCAALVNGVRSKNLREEVETLRQQYDNFTDSVKHLFSLLDRSLTVRLDGVL